MLSLFFCTFEAKLIEGIMKLKNFLLVLGLMPLGLGAQEKVVPFKFGNMDQWITRKIEESSIIGGNTKLLYEVGPTQEVVGNIAYTNLGGSPWATSNVMAKVVGIVKTNTSVFPEARDGGYCARLETRIESVKVLGMVNITVIAAGALYLGDIQEPITSTKGGEKAVNSGVPFTSRPKAIRFDYKVKMSGEENRLKMTGFSKKATIPGKDYVVMTCLLQNRKEDIHGNILSKRVGTAVVRFDKNQDWQNGATFEIMYGDITSRPEYVEEYMGLSSTNFYARNKAGESVKIQEVGWAAPNEAPTHLLLQFCSSHGGAFVGSPGNTFWVDNVEMVY